MALRHAPKAVLDRLAKVWLLEDCSAAELAKVVRLGTILTVQGGRELTRQGDGGSDMFVLLAGNVDVRRRGAPPATMRAGSAIGELALVDDGVRTATVTTIGPCEVLVIRRREFRALLSEAPTVGVKLLQAMSRRLRAAERANLRLQVIADERRTSAAARRRQY